MFFHTAESAQLLGEQLRVIEVAEGDWTRRLLDESTGQQWLEYYPYPDDRSPKHLRADPLPEDLHELITAALSSNDSEDWSGLAAYLCQTHAAEAIAHVLDDVRWIVPAQALRAFAKAYIPQDQRNLVGMTYAEVTASYERYRKACSQIQSFSTIDED